MKKIFSFIIMGIFLMSSISMASAMSEYEQDIYNQMTNIFAKIKYAITKGFLLFTSWGEINGCSTYPDWEGWIRGSMSKPTSLPNSISCSKVSSTKCAIDIWYDNTAYLGGAVGPPSKVNWDNWLKEVTTGSFSSTSRPYYYVEIYKCPTTPPVTDDWETKVYKCENGNWINKGSYGKTESCSYDPSGSKRCWCNDEDENFYIDKSGNIHCQSSSYSNVKDGTWCPAYNAHATKICSDNDVYWVDSNNNVADKSQECGTAGCLGNACRSSPEPEPVSCTTREELGTAINSWIAGSITRDALGIKLQSWSEC